MRCYAKHFTNINSYLYSHPIMKGITIYSILQKRKLKLRVFNHQPKKDHIPRNWSQCSNSGLYGSKSEAFPLHVQIRLGLQRVLVQCPFCFLYRYLLTHSVICSFIRSCTEQVLFARHRVLGVDTEMVRRSIHSYPARVWGSHCVDS